MPIRPEGDTNRTELSWSLYTMTAVLGSLKDVFMRTVLILATVATAAVQMMWRVMRSPKQPALAAEWTADE